MHFSMVLPVYNSERTLFATLSSLECLEDKSRWEIIISDDSSADSTRDIAAAWIAGPGSAFRRCVLVENPVNLGISGNHASGFAAATGEYGLYIGGDDLVENANLAADLDAAIEKSPGVRVAKLDLEALIAGSGRRERLYRFKRFFFQMSSRRQFVALALFGSFLYAGPGTILHIPTLRAIGGGFDPRFRTYEDLPLFFAFLTRGYRIRFLPVEGVVWYRSSASLSKGGFSRTGNRFSEERAMERAYIRSKIEFFGPYEKFLLRLRKYPKYLRYLFYSLHPSWLRNRLLPSILKKIRLIKG
jgi:glycosyltransferase involved in cell wall biosynthesis